MAAREQRRCRAPSLASLGALLLTLATAEVAHAEPEETARAQMRSAAELQAEVEPERMVRANESLRMQQLAQLKSPTMRRSEALRQIALSALRGELARELEYHETPTPHAGVGAKDPGGHESAAQARTAAIAAQLARQAHSVAALRGASAAAPGAGKGGAVRN